MDFKGLNQDQKKRLKPYIEEFIAYSKSDKYVEDIKERNERFKYFQVEFPQKLNELSEEDVFEFVSKLWASEIWGNKQYLVQKIISDNTLEKLSNELIELLDINTPAEIRYEHFVNNIKGLGPASVTEILCNIEPERCAIWNMKARTALKVLEFDEVINPKVYQIKKEQYALYIKLVESIAKEMKNAGIKEVNLMIVDYLFYQVIQKKTTDSSPVIEREGFDHNEIRDLISSIGMMLGFETNTEFKVAHGAIVDCVWRAKIGNLGLVTYVFEVHNKGSIDSLMLNLQKANSSSTVQKVVAVSDEKQLETIEKETEGLPAEFIKTLSFWPVSEVLTVGEKLDSALRIINDLGLVQGKF